MMPLIIQCKGNAGDNNGSGLGGARVVCIVYPALLHTHCGFYLGRRPLTQETNQMLRVGRGACPERATQAPDLGPRHHPGRYGDSPFGNVDYRPEAVYT